MSTTLATHRSFLQAATAAAGATGLSTAQGAPAPFKPTWDSLADGYETPDWFRNAKFGIWAHGGAIERIEAVGAGDSLPFKRSRRGLEVKPPEGLAGSPAVALKIRGNGLT